MISPVKTLIANMTDRPSRLYLKGRSLFVISPKNTPGSVVEIEGDVFSRIENNTEAEFFLEQILNGYLTISYSVDERFVCTGCPQNTNMNLPSKYVSRYRGEDKKEKVVVKAVNESKKPEEKPINPVEETKKEEQIKLPEENIKPAEEQKKEEEIAPKETSIKPAEEAKSEEKTLSEIANTSKADEDKPKRNRKIKVQ